MDKSTIEITTDRFVVVPVPVELVRCLTPTVNQINFSFHEKIDSQPVKPAEFNRFLFEFNLNLLCDSYRYADDFVVETDDSVHYSVPLPISFNNWKNENKIVIDTYYATVEFYDRPVFLLLRFDSRYKQRKLYVKFSIK